MQVTPLGHRMPGTSAQQNITVRPRKSPDSDRSFFPKLINYDIFEKKSPQQLLYESAQEKDDHKSILKWGKFKCELDKCIGKNKYAKHLVKTLDDTKQWAALHYAVFNNNRFVCDKLTGTKLFDEDSHEKQSDDKYFLCDVNIVTGNGENVLHIAARSSSLWQPISSSDSTYATKIIDEENVSMPKIIVELIERGADVHHLDDEGRTPLHLAVMNNRLSFVKYLLCKKAKLYAVTKLYANVLHFTFIPSGQNEKQLFDMLSYIINKLQARRSTWNFPWINEQNNLAIMRTLDNRTPLAFAVCHPNTSERIVELLLTLNESPTIEILVNQLSPKLDFYQTQLLIAIEQVAKAKRRVTKFGHLYPLLVDCDRKIRNQLFHFPCRHNNVNLLKWLINPSSENNDSAKRRTLANQNINLNEPDHAGYTPLLTAVFYKSTECFQHLSQLNVESCAQANTKMPSMYVDIKATNLDGENILHICAKHSVSDELFRMVWNLANQNGLLQEKDANGNRPLHVAAGNNQVNMCEELLEVFKSDSNLLCKKNTQGQTAAHIATEAEPHRIGPDRHYVDKKEKKNSEDDETDKVENDKAEKVKNKNQDFGLHILKLMWRKTKESRDKSLLFQVDNDRQTCLHLAVAKGHQNIVEFLVEKVGLEVDAIADRRLTPLHLACQYGQGEIVAYLIEHGASPTLRNAELYNSLEIAIMNQHEDVVKELLTLPNWRELMSNAQRIYHSEAYDTPMRKLIRYMPNVAVWMIETNLTQTVGGQGRHVFKKVYDYEFYMDAYRVKQWYAQDVQLPDEEESFSERWHRRGCDALCCCTCCCENSEKKLNEENSNLMPYTDDAYTLIRNLPIFIASEQEQCPDLVEHPYNTFLRAQLFKRNKFYVVRLFSFILYAAFLGLWTALILLGKHPQYFFNKASQNMTVDLDLCANVSRTLTNANDSEALKTTVYIRLKYALYAFLIFFVVENIILILALFPRIFRTIDYILEISAFVFTFVYIYDWYDWQDPVVFRCPIQYQIGAMGLLFSWFSMLTYIKRATLFNMGVFVAMIQIIGFKFLRFIPVLLVVICGFGFTHWMLLQNQAPFSSPVEAVIRTGLLMFELGYEDHLYKDDYYYTVIFVVTILASIVFCIFILNLLISVAVGEMPSLTVQGQTWQSQMLYDLLSDYFIVSIQIARFANFLTCGYIRRQLYNRGLQPIVVLEEDKTDSWFKRAKKYVQMHFFDEKIQEDIIPIKTSQDASKDEK